MSKLKLNLDPLSSSEFLESGLDLLEFGAEQGEIELRESTLVTGDGTTK